MHKGAPKNQNMVGIITTGKKIIKITTPKNKNHYPEIDISKSLPIFKRITIILLKNHFGFFKITTMSSLPIPTNFKIGRDESLPSLPLGAPLHIPLVIVVHR